MPVLTGGKEGGDALISVRPLWRRSPALSGLNAAACFLRRTCSSDYTRGARGC